MELINAPAKIVLAFAADGDKNVIPVPSQIPITPGAASYTTGFPPLTMVDPSAGGVGPSGLDFNGILNAATAIDLWVSAGGIFPYDATFSAAVGGYPKGALLQQASGGGFWVSTVDNNVTDPDTGGAGWASFTSATTVIRMSSSVYASAQQTLTTGTSKVLWDTVEFDSAGLWDAADKRFVATVAGKYRLSGSVMLSAPGAQGPIATQVFLNGVIAKQCFEAPQVSNVNLSMPFDAIVNLAAGDYLEVFMTIPETDVLAGQSGSNQAFVYGQLEYLGT